MYFYSCLVTLYGQAAGNPDRANDSCNSLITSSQQGKYIQFLLSSFTPQISSSKCLLIYILSTIILAVHWKLVQRQDNLSAGRFAC